MSFLLEIGQIFITTFLYTFLMPMFWVVLFLVYLQYRRQSEREEKIYGRVINPLRRQIIGSLTLGAAGGFAASVILVFLGLSLEQIGLYFIWPVALLLLLIHPRYLCFAYAGGIVALAVLFTRYVLLTFFPVIGQVAFFESLLKIHIPALLVLIGLLHLVEALLMYFGGHQGSSPVYLKQGNGEVVGAYMLQRFWPLPLVALLVSVVPEAEIVGVSMPDWWPILKSLLQPEAGQTLQYMVIPVAAGLGYADLAVSSHPAEKSRRSARGLAIYSILLLLVALAAEYWPVMVIPGVLLAPVGHEALIMIGNRAEKEALPLFTRTGRGVALMSVIKGSAADKSGLQAGDVIMKINNEEVDSCTLLADRIEQSYFMVLLDGEREGEPLSLILNKHLLDNERSQVIARAGAGSGYRSVNILHRCATLGFITFPDPDTSTYVEMKEAGFSERWSSLKNRVYGFFSGILKNKR